MHGHELEALPPKEPQFLSAFGWPYEVTNDHRSVEATEDIMWIEPETQIRRKEPKR